LTSRTLLKPKKLFYMNRIRLYSIFFTIVIIFLSSLDVFAQKPLKIGLTLSGGGAKGIAHIGVLKVLEEAGIPIDYITGTSMGSIVGGLYAIGYTPDSIEYITKSVNWDDLISDKIERKNLSIEEKYYYEKYVLSMPIKKRKIYLPDGMHRGQNISMLLNNLTRHVHNVKDFSQFYIPYACVVADIENGEAVTLRNGALSEAMRASMAIPTIFTPVELDGHLYVDGGLLNNFPVIEAKEMGADIMIGVDVQSPYLRKEEITSPVQVMSQASKILRAEANQASSALCNIIIKPNVTSFSVMEFDAHYQILQEGIKAARAALPQIIALLDSLGIPHNGKTKPRPDLSLATTKIDLIEIAGLKSYSSQQMINKLHLNTDSTIHYKQIEEAINRIYGSQNFDIVTYKIENLDNRQVLKINVKEKNVRDLKVGIHYDLYLKTGLLLNYTSNNLIMNGLKLRINAVVSENPRGDIKLMFKNNSIISPEIKVWGGHYQLEYYRNNEAFSGYDINIYGSGFYINSNIYNNLRLSTGVEYTHNTFQSASVLMKFTDSYQNLFNSIFKVEFDSRNSEIYPNSGFFSKTEARLINDGIHSPAFSLMGKYEWAFPLFSRLSFQPKFNFGVMWEELSPLWYYYRIGGYHGWESETFVRFVGYHFNEYTTSGFGIAAADLQYEFLTNHFIIGRFNILKTNDNPEDLINFDHYIPNYGFGLTYSLKSLIGPIELTTMVNEKNQWHVLFNLGYWF